MIPKQKWSLCMCATLGWLRNYNKIPWHPRSHLEPRNTIVLVNLYSDIGLARPQGGGKGAPPPPAPCPGPLHQGGYNLSERWFHGEFHDDTALVWAGGWELYGVTAPSFYSSHRPQGKVTGGWWGGRGIYTSPPELPAYSQDIQLTLEQDKSAIAAGVGPKVLT